MSRLFAFLLALGLAGGAAAAPLQRDLGLGLFYFRVHALPGDLPTDDSVRRHPCILDVRYVKGQSAAATALAGWLKFHAGTRTPVFLLANGETSPALLGPLASPDSVAGLVIIGPASGDFTPDIALSVPPAEGRAAYQALEKGAAVESLIAESIDKQRNDEAMLAREHLSDSAAGEASDPPLDKAPAPAKDARRPILDRVLQRAVQLHRALVALKRVSPA